jgi:septum formation protein
MSTISSFKSGGITLLPHLSKINSGSYRVILASGSPRRKELLSLIGIPSFDVLVSSFPENLDPKSFSTPDLYCLNTAKKKVEDVVVSLSAKRMEETDKINCLVIGADTVVTIDNMILEKPKDKIDAKRMITLLSGRQHTVYTGVIIYGNKEASSVSSKASAPSSSVEGLELLDSFVEASHVWFASLNEEDIAAYVETGEGKDKAGGYGIQGIGGQFVERIEGCYFNIMGLPLHKLSVSLARILQQHNSEQTSSNLENGEL